MSPRSSKETKVRAGLAVSSIGHAIILGWGLVAFAPAAFDTPKTESMPVDLVPVSELTQLQAGDRSAPKKEQPKQEAKKEAEPKQDPATAAIVDAFAKGNAKPAKAAKH